MSELTADIYGLYDPDTNELRYIGKANNAEKRLKSHLSDARRNNKRPVCLWIQELTALGKLPVIRVIETVQLSEWKIAERRLIAHYRTTSNLLNLAPGGDMPSMTKEQRAENGRKMNAKFKASDPKWQRWVNAKRDMTRLYRRLQKKPNYQTYWLRLYMKCCAANNPERYGSWATL
jgi:hypothetical protein